MKTIYNLLFLLALTVFITSCSKKNDTTQNNNTNQNTPLTVNSTNLAAKWAFGVDSMLVFDNGAQVQQSEAFYANTATTFNYITFKADGTGLHVVFDGSETDTNLTYSLLGNAITLNFQESDMNDPAYTLTGSVKTLTATMLVLYMQQSVVNGPVTEVTTHHMYFTKE